MTEEMQLSNCDSLYINIYLESIIHLITVLPSWAYNFYIKTVFILIRLGLSTGIFPPGLAIITLKAGLSSPSY